MTRNECEEIGLTDDASKEASVERLRSAGITSGRWASVPQEFSVSDYLTTREKLTYEAMYFPLGYPVRLLSNSPVIFSAAIQSWSSFHPVFHREALEILVNVKSEGIGGDMLPPAPTHMQKGDLLLQVADSGNFFIADLRRGRALVQITETTACSANYFRYHMLEAAALCMLASLRAIAIHGACVRVEGRGVLLCGDSGDGKSTLAYAGSRAGWTYVSDDATYMPIDREDRLVVGNCHHMRFRPAAAELFPELVGRPVTPRAAGKPSIEVRTSEWPQLSTASGAFIDHVVFLNRKYVDKQEVISLRASTVWPWFKQHLLSAPDSRAAQENTLSRLLSARVSELRYQDLDCAIENIGQLVRKGN